MSIALQHGTVDTTPSTKRVRSGYANQMDDPWLAVKEVFDNMVLAGATNISVETVLDKNRRISMTFRDDGHGLENKGLQEALKPHSSQDGSGGNEHGIGGFGGLSCIGSFKHLRTRHANDGFAYEVNDIEPDQVMWQEIALPDTGTFFEIRMENCMDYNTRTEKNNWKKIADIYSNHIKDGLVIEPRYIDSSGNQLHKNHFTKLYAPPMHLLYPKGSISTLKRYSEPSLGVEINIETKVIDPTHHDRKHPVPCTGGGMRIYVSQSGIRTVWDRTQQQLGMKWRGRPSHPSLNALAIYITFTKGRCKAKPIKNNLVVTDPVFPWLQEKIKEHLNNDIALQPFISIKDPEAIIQSNLVTSMLPIMQHTNILELQDDGFGGEMDIISKDSSIDCVWEVKAVKFDHKAVRQLYWYLQKGGYDRAYAVGVGFTPAANSMISELVTNDKLDIVKIDLTDSKYSHYLP